MINPFAWSPFATGSLRMAFVIAPAVILGILCGLPWGPKGVVTGYSVATGSLLPILIVWAIHGRGITVGDYRRSARKPLMAGLLATVCGRAVKVGLTGIIHPIVLFIGDLTLCVAVFLWALLFGMGQKDLYMDVVRHALKRSVPKTSPAISQAGA